MAVERVERLRAQPLGVDQIAAEDIERQRQARVDADVGPRIGHLIREVPRLSGRRVARQHARTVPAIAALNAATPS